MLALLLDGPYRGEKNRTGNGRCSGVFGGAGGAAGASAAAKTKQLGFYDQGPEEAQVQARMQAAPAGASG